ncbi:MAG: MmgE/PrpD family protein [Kordiimonadaceae bacterium]|nr:MmgE/PrpD family protein [Kordiimonadaceae bacterium]MBO6567453.1 MmgE/PrpD family protein [Kordiimonadaceae bacterium]MBO6963333.1 MmgE/PrpD family protein [Kordiimonadaceae bacterium]
MTQSSSLPNNLRAFLEFALGETTAQASDQTYKTASRFLADTLGCSLAGSGSATNKALQAAFDRNRAGYSIPGRERRQNKECSALLTSHAIHCLEWDAVHEPAVVHAMSVTTGALWAELQDNSLATGRDLLECIIVGVEIASRLGVASESALRFFRPATAGLLGAAAAICRMRQLKIDVAADAMGLAYSQVQGTMQAHLEGTSALAIQVALSARAALNACDMAEAGLTGPHDILSGPFGYFTLIEEGGNPDSLGEGFGDTFAIDELSIKPYPTGRASHGVLSVLMKHMNSGIVTKNNFARLTAEVPPLIHRLVGRPYKPGMTEAYARLCLPYLVGLALEDGSINPKRFSAVDFADVAVTAHTDKVEVVVDNNPDLNALAPQRVSIELTDGRIISEAVPATLGSPANPLTETELKQKFLLAASLSHIEIANTSQIFDNLLNLSDAPIAFDVLKQLVPEQN